MYLTVFILKPSGKKEKKLNNQKELAARRNENLTKELLPSCHVPLPAVSIHVFHFFSFSVLLFSFSSSLTCSFPFRFLFLFRHVLFRCRSFSINLLFTRSSPHSAYFPFHFTLHVPFHFPFLCLSIMPFCCPFLSSPSHPFCCF